MAWRLDLTPPASVPAPVLDPRQQAVVEHARGPLLVLAGPGTGKTTTIVEAIVARIHGGLAPDRVLGLTFGRRAATELRQRVLARLGGEVDGRAGPTITTVHAFAYGLLRRTADPDEYLTVPRLLSGAEEDVRVRDLLRGAVAEGIVQWPRELEGALPTLGLAAEVRAVLARARAVGLDGDRLQALGQEVGRPAWAAVGQFARHDQDVMALEGVMDYGELLEQAVGRCLLPQVAQWLRSQYRAIYVDEYQETDPLQVELLRALAAPGALVVAVGDPDQAIYAFRGSDARAMSRFPVEFGAGGSDDVPVIALRRTYRFGPRIRAAAEAVLGPALVPGLPAAVLAEHRRPTCFAPGGASNDGDGGEGTGLEDVVEVRSYDDEGALAAHVALDLRIAHVQRGVPWSGLAVLARSAGQLPVLARALRAGGVPVAVAADEIPLAAEPAVRVLLSAMQVASRPVEASPAQVLDLLTGPLCGLEPTQVRRLGRALRGRARRSALAAPASERLLRDLVVDPLVGDGPPPERGSWLDGLPGPEADRVGDLVGLLRSAQLLGAQAAAPEHVLWALWDGPAATHGWPQRLRSAALAGSSAANHDLDAVIALFDTAERLTDRYRGVLGIDAFVAALADQQIPAEPVSERSTRAETVRLLTVHRAKGLEWDEVWLVGLEEGRWPDLRARGSTLRVDEVTADGIGAGSRPADLLAEERRLAFVGCTRARRRLHVTTIDAPTDGGERRSRFVDDLAAAGFDATVIHGRPGRPLTLDGLVAELRSAAADPTAGPTVRQAAIDRLGVLAAERTPDGVAVVPLADPAAWWGVDELTVGPVPVRDPQQPVALSGSSLDAVVGCPLKWFWEHEVSAVVPRGAATGFGSIVHAIADFVAKGDLPTELDEVDRRAGQVWSELRFDASWQAEAERGLARAALERFLRYHERADRRLVGTEVQVSAELEVPTPQDGPDRVRLSGYIDRVEVDGAGALVPIDLKNMKTAPRATDIPEHGQLGVYQLLLRHGAWRPDPAQPDAEGPDGARPDRLGVVGGAALVQLRVEAGSGDTGPLVQTQAALPTEGPTWVEERLGAAAQVVRREQFDAIVGPACRYCALRTACPAQSVGAAVTP